MKKPAYVCYPISGQPSIQHDAGFVETAADAVRSIDADQHAARSSRKVRLTAPAQTT